MSTPVIMFPSRRCKGGPPERAEADPVVAMFGELRTLAAAREAQTDAEYLVEDAIAATPATSVAGIIMQVEHLRTSLRAYAETPIIATILTGLWNLEAAGGGR